MERGLSLHARRELIQHKRQAYQEADPITKSAVLDEITALTSYHRSYARWLLNHPEAAQPAAKRSRPRQYGPKVQHLLFLVWHKANRICTKRLMPYLPTWLDVLERHEHVQITPECRAQLLAMSASTADRLLRSQRMHGLRGLSTTKAGTLLRQHIPIRTSQHWNETQPGFLEADLVAHSGLGVEGAYLFTLTLTDVATGWTECLPVFSKSQEQVLTAFQRARTLFPFPILGLDTDCGSEFLNEEMVAYCTREQIMLTRGRPAVKNDQCFVETKNRHIVRQVIGHDRYSGEYAYRQMTEVYRALRLYVNCFQPSMKLVARDEEASPVRRSYDPAKTPLQRLLLSRVLSSAKEQELMAVVQALDPVRLFSQLELLQHALFRCAVNASPFSYHQPVTPIQVFAWEHCTDGPLPPSLRPAHAASSSGKNDLQVERILDWRRYRTNPFKGEWEYIASCLRTHPDLTTPDLFRQLQHRSPGRYHSGHLRSLQRGVRHIHARLLFTCHNPGPAELIHGTLPETTIPFPLACGEAPSEVARIVSSDKDSARTALSPRRAGSLPKATRSRRADEKRTAPPGQPGASPSDDGTECPKDSPLDQAMQVYLRELTDASRSPKTVLWHQTALGFLRQYLHIHQRIQEPGALTEKIICD